MTPGILVDGARAAPARRAVSPAIEAASCLACGADDARPLLQSPVQMLSQQVPSMQ